MSQVCKSERVGHANVKILKRDAKMMLGLSLDPEGCLQLPEPLGSCVSKGSTISDGPVYFLFNCCTLPKAS